jgi:protein-S-isoprenylcysteine O-methyltransferase Ste14
MTAIEQWVRLLGAVALLLFLGVAIHGAWRGLGRAKGREVGQARRMLRGPAYLFIAVGYFGAWVLLWRPLPLALSAPARAVALLVGALLYFPGLGLYLWARRALGSMYNVSSALGARLYAEHRLVTHGPYALVRHPMYVGVLAASLGGVLLYRTWTPVFAAVTFLGLALRARQEERALAREFGEEWEAYARRVPGWLPRR